MDRSPRTHCSKDHPLTGDSAYVIPSSGRITCKACGYNRHLARKLRPGVIAALSRQQTERARQKRARGECQYCASPVSGDSVRFCSTHHERLLAKNRKLFVSLNQTAEP